MNKIYILVYDGAGDRPIDALNGMTPLEYADTPALDSLAKKGLQSLITIIDDVIAPESDSGCMALLSYDPLVYYTGRGPLEAYGANLFDPTLSCVAFRVNFASYQDGCLERRTARGLNDSELQALTSSVNSELKLDDYFGTTFKLISYRNHRGIVCFYNKKITLSGNVSYTDPGFERIGYFGLNIAEYEPIPKMCIPLDETEDAAHTANIVNLFVERAHPILDKHIINYNRLQQGQLAANYFLIRDGGDFPVEMPNFFDKYGKQLTIFGQLSAEKAIADIIGATFEYSRQHEDEGDVDFFSDLIRKLLASDSDIVFAHLKGPDEPGHDNKPFEKVAAIESLDSNFLTPLLDKIDDTDLVVVTCDHATPCDMKLHSKDAVPIVVSGRSICADSTTRFGESYALDGKLPIIKATQLIDYLINCL